MEKAASVVAIERSLDDMLAVSDIEYRKVEMPEWKGTIYLGSVSAADIIEWQESSDGDAKRTAGVRLLVKSLVNREAYEGLDGAARIGTDKHIAAFKSKSHKAIDRLVREILDLNGMKVKDNAAKND